jgi:glycosyltransferase involved in cell wall biosynthesis
MAMQPIIQLIGSGAFGGGTSVVLNLSRDLARRGVPVIVASDRGSYLIEAARSCGLGTLELDFGGRVKTPLLTMRLARAVQELQPRLIHAHGARAGLPVALIPEQFRCPFVYTVHGFHYQSKSPPMKHFGRRAERFCMARAAATVFVSDRDRSFAVGDDVLPNRSHHLVIHNGTAAVEAAGQSGQEPLFDIAFLGRLEAVKNPLALADFLVALRPMQPSLAIIGGGECEAPLRERLQAAGAMHQVTFLGTQPADKAIALLSRARIQVLPSLSEGLPVSVIEAMHLGIPTVASDVGGLSELIDDGTSGFLLPSMDIAGFAERLRCLLQDEPRRRAMGQAAREKARLGFSLERNVDQHVALYGSMIRRPVSSGSGLVMRALDA